MSVFGHSFAHARLSQLFPKDYQNIESFLQSKNINSVEEYVLWAQENLTYTSDETKDDWAEPLITLNKRSGDCEDMAFLHAEVIRYFGYEPRVLGYGENNEAHVITLFVMEGKYYIFDNAKFYRDIQSPSLKEIFGFLASKHNARYMIELNFASKNFKVLYVNQKPAA